MAKILLVEDEDNLREIYEARLEAEGFKIVSAKDGEEALAIAKAEKPDLIISDIMMPKISGFEMLDILRNTKDTKNIKIIMLTALGQGDDLERANSLGADKYLVKSQVTLEDIVKTTYEMLGQNKDEKNPPNAENDQPEDKKAEDIKENPEKIEINQPTEPKVNEPENAPIKPTNIYAPPTDDAQPKTTNIYAPPTDEKTDETPAETSIDVKTEDQNNQNEVKQDESSEKTTKIEVQHDDSHTSHDQIENIVSGASSDASPPDLNSPQPVDNSSKESVESTNVEENSDTNKSNQSAAIEIAKPPDEVNTQEQAQPEVVEEKKEDQALPENVIIAPTEDLSQVNEHENKGVIDEPPPLLKQKVITPLKLSNKPNIEALYAKEQAKEVTQGTVKPVVIDMSDPAPHQPENNDANGIAL